jgi:uncharacterized protein (DUF1684 family)
MSVAVQEQGFERWRAARRRAVAGPTGNLALVETRWLAAGEEPDLGAALVGQPASVTATRLERPDPLTGAVERGVRLWDADSPAIRAFEGIDTFAYDPAWVVEAHYEEIPGARLVAFEHIRDNGGTRDLVVPGDITATIGGRDHVLSAFDDDGVLLLAFGDQTNGRSTYGAGRFLTVPREPGSDRVILDFNRARVPPCGFSPHFNCPMPPPQNKLGVAVEAGEKLPVFRSLA